MISTLEGFDYKKKIELGICILNNGIEKGVLTESENFVLKDNLGNHYLSHSETNFDKKLISDKPLCQYYTFEIFDPDKYGIQKLNLLLFNDGVLLSSEMINASVVRELRKN